MRWGIMEPFAKIHQLELQISHLDFGLLVFSVVLVAAGGYLINDYFDLKIDRINKPERIIVGRYIKRRVAIVLHWVIHALGLILGFYISFKIGLWQLCFIHIFWILSMWFYSTEFKRQLIVGNIIIALCLALVPLSVALFELPAMEFYYGPKILKIAEEYEQAKQNITVEVGGTSVELKEDPRTAYASFRRTLFYWILAFSGFAFFMTITREILKDAADREGDRTYGCKTIPIVWGTKATKAIVVGLYVFMIAGALFLQQLYLKDKWTFLFVLALLVPMLIASLITTLTAKNNQGFHKASTINKLTSVVGVSYAILAHFLILQFA